MTIVLIMLLAAFAVANQRSKIFESRLENLHFLQTDKLLQLRQELNFQAEIALNLISTDEQFLTVLTQTTEQYATGVDSAEFNQASEQLQFILSEYLNRLSPFAATHIKVYLAPDAQLVISSTNAGNVVQHHAVLPAIIVYAQQQAQLVNGLGLEPDGMGLKAVMPITVDGRLHASIELVLGLQQVARVRQAWRQSHSDKIPNLFLQSAILVNNTAIDAYYAEAPPEWFRGAVWSTLHPNQLLHNWMAQNIVSAKNYPPFQLVSHAGRYYLLSVMPWHLWGQHAAETEQSVSVQWQDVTSHVDSYKQEQSISALILMLTTIVLIFLGILTIHLLRTLALREVAHQQKLLQQSEKKFYALYQLSPLPIFLNRFNDGVYIEVNPAMENLVGYSQDELLLLSSWDLTPECYSNAEQEQLKLLVETGHYGPYVKQYRHKNGELIDIELNGVLFVDSEGESYIWTIIQDIREIKRVEKLKDDFVSTVSHELRTPLTSIGGSLGLVLGGACGELSPKAEKLLSIAHKNSQRLNLLINDLLDIEKLVAGKMHFDKEEVSLSTLLQEALEQNQPYARQHNVTLTLDSAVEATLWIDAARIQQVLANLLSNAIKFSPAGAQVRLAAEIIHGRAHISVNDQGPGISVLDQHRLFKRFSQLDHSAGQPRSGTGLGLAISREIVLQSGGDIGLSSEPGKGAEFWFDLPLNSEPKVSINIAAGAAE